MAPPMHAHGAAGRQGRPADPGDVWPVPSAIDCRSREGGSGATCASLRFRTTEDGTKSYVPAGMIWSNGVHVLLYAPGQARCRQPCTKWGVCATCVHVAHPQCDGLLQVLIWGLGLRIGLGLVWFGLIWVGGGEGGWQQCWYGCQRYADARHPGERGSVWCNNGWGMATNGNGNTRIEMTEQARHDAAGDGRQATSGRGKRGE